MASSAVFLLFGNEQSSFLGFIVMKISLCSSIMFLLLNISLHLLIDTFTTPLIKDVGNNSNLNYCPTNSNTIYPPVTHIYEVNTIVRIEEPEERQSTS